MKKFSITKNGKPLSKKLYSWNEKTKTFSSEENFLTLDFSNYNEVTFKTGNDCTFDTGYWCTFNTGYGCTFNTGFDCCFKTESRCTFNTGSDCCFNTGSRCTFSTGYGCTFSTGYRCIFNTVGEECVLVRRDIFEVIELHPGIKIVLNDFKVKGFLNKEEIMEQLL